MLSSILESAEPELLTIKQVMNQKRKSLAEASTSDPGKKNVDA